MKYFVRSCVILLLLSAASVRADIIWLKNGDRISGKIQSMDSGNLLIVLGKRTELVVSWDDVKTVRSSTVLWVKTDIFGEERPTTFREAMSGMVLMDDNNLLALAQIKSMNRQTDLPRDFSWEGNLDLNVKSHRDGDLTSDYFKTTLDSRLRTYYWRHRLQGSGEYEIKNKLTSTSKYSVGYSIDRLLDEDWFWRLRGDYKRDNKATLWLQEDVATGIGYRFWDNSISRFELTTEWIRFYYQQKFIPGIDLSWKIDAMAFGWDWKQEVLASTLQFYSFGYYYKPVDGEVSLVQGAHDISSVDLKVYSGAEMEWGVRYRLTQYVNASAKFIWDFVEGQDIYQNDRRYELGVGVEW